VDTLNLAGAIIVVAWLLCGFYAAGILENTASRERIPGRLFSFLELLALVLGPAAALAVWIDGRLAGGFSGWLKDKRERRSQVPLVIFDGHGQELYQAGESRNRDLGQAITELKKLLYDAVRLHASDIFVDPHSGGTLQLRLRVDGALRVLRELDPQLGGNLINVIKVAAGMDITEKRRPQDGAFSLESDLGRSSLRVASVGAFGGEKLTIRLLGAGAGPKTLEETGLSGEELRCLRSAARLPSGMVLICGPTGSGKTTTLYALLKTIDYRMKNVISIEDPIEHVMENVSQMEVNAKAGITFAQLLRNSLRQNPDVICLGEIRDEETAQVAVHAAQTGHLIIATVHSSDNVGTIDRIVNLGVPLRSVAGVLQVIVSQRLVRRLCDCAEPDTPSPELAEYLRQAGLPADKLRKAKGCRKCDGTGYLGRQALFDVMVMDDRLRAAFEDEHATLGAIKAELASRGTSVIAYAGYKLAAAGLTSVEEVERVTFDMEHEF